MTDTQIPSPNDSSDALSFLEKLVDIRLLVLFVSLLFYIDIWIIKSKVDPTILTLDQLSVKIKAVPVFTVIIFFLSFSIVVGGFFPVFRKLIGLASLYVTSFNRSVSRGRSIAQQRLSDWALAFVCLSLYDLVVGLWSEGPYKGLSLHLVNIIGIDGFEAGFFRLIVGLFWIVCLLLAIEVDEP